MTKLEMSEKGLELVAYSGEARGMYLLAIKKAKDSDFTGAEKIVVQGDQALAEAHKAQTELLHAEAAGNYSDVTMIMVHGQDHLMTTVLLKELVGTIIDLYKK